MDDTTKELVDALTEIVNAQLGPQGAFPRIGPDMTRRTEEILLILLKHGRVVRAHQRVWTIDIPADLVPAARAAGGFLSLEEKHAQAQDR